MQKIDSAVTSTLFAESAVEEPSADYTDYADSKDIKSEDGVCVTQDGGFWLNYVLNSVKQTDNFLFS